MQILDDHQQRLTAAFVQQGLGDAVQDAVLPLRRIADAPQRQLAVRYEQRLESIEDLVPIRALYPGQPALQPWR